MGVAGRERGGGKRKRQGEEREKSTLLPTLFPASSETISSVLLSPGAVLRLNRQATKGRPRPITTAAESAGISSNRMSSTPGVWGLGFRV